MAAVVLVLIVTAVVTVVSAVLWLWSHNKTRKIMLKMPGPPCLPIIGNAHMFKPNGRGMYGYVKA